jgi:multidrug efflux pump subunit AcrA (membrane-fusion protein)
MKKPSKATWVTVISVGAAVGFWSSKLLVKKDDAKGKTAAQQLEGMAYWTCPMHPQIHSDRPGECPICHMKLVQVRAQGSHAVHEERESRGAVSASPDEMQLLGVQKVAVEKMDLTAHVPISGRLLSPLSVAFQVYESDLRYVRSGLPFHGTSSFHPETPIQGTITSVDNIVDPTSRTVRVLGQIKSGPHGLISETTFSGEIDITLKAVTAIPESAVLHTGTQDLAYVVENDGKLAAHEVKLGQKTESYYEVVDGLTPGELISSGPNFLLDSEAKIRAASEPQEGGGGAPSTPSCPAGEHWDIPMAMCMPGKAK